jgi:membrane protein implicated in regulation of membrane protease activity
MLQRGLFCAAAVVMVCAIGAALLQLAVLILSMSSPAAITVMALVALILLNSLRRRIRGTASHRFGPRNPHSPHSLHR